MEHLQGFFTSPSPLEDGSLLGYNGGFQGGKINGLSGLMEQMDVPASLNLHTATGIISQDQSFGYDDEKNNNGLLVGTEMKLEKKKGSDKKIRKPRYAFQTRSHVDILDDGYRWRKYGQKSVKNNKFPRSYYRCTHQGCNVKKQIQRLTKDEGMVLTTYEGMHSHPIQKSNDNFEHILGQMQIFTSF